VQYFDFAWWHQYGLRASELRFIRERPGFIDIKGNALACRCIILIFRPYCKGPSKIYSIDINGQPSIYKRKNK